MKKTILACLLLALANHALATAIHEGGCADARIKFVTYNPNRIVALKGAYGYQTQISFAPDEIIQSVSLGDSLAWQAVPVANYLFIKPVTASKTNMTVLTNSNSYNFQLDSRDPQATPTYQLKFVYESAENKKASSPAVPVFDPAKVNAKYSFTGDRNIIPIQAFDNGQFTYFKFKQDGLSRLPAIFIVDKKRNETLVNYHMQGGYLVIHGVAKQFTLRDGVYVANVYNDLAIGDWANI